MGAGGGETGLHPGPGEVLERLCSAPPPGVGGARIAPGPGPRPRPERTPAGRPARAALGAIVVAVSAACVGRSSSSTEGPTAPPEVAQNPVEVDEQGLATVADAEWRVLFDGADLGEWRTGVYGDPPDYEVTDDGVVLPQTAWLSGMTYDGDVPRTPYRLEVEATRRYGSDFFLGVTFPVRDSHLTLVLGGWGGAVSGLSCIDGKDASDNDTRTSRYFPNGKRQTVVIDVADDRIVATVNGEGVVDRALAAAEELSLRTEVIESRPLGLAAFATSTTVHSVRVRPLSPGSIQARRTSAP